MVSKKRWLEQKPLHIWIVIGSYAVLLDHAPSRTSLRILTETIFIKWPWAECVGLHLRVSAVLTCSTGQNQRVFFPIIYINISGIWIAQKLLNHCVWHPDFLLLFVGPEHIALLQSYCSVHWPSAAQNTQHVWFISCRWLNCSLIEIEPHSSSLRTSLRPTHPDTLGSV